MKKQGRFYSVKIISFIVAIIGIVTSIIYWVIRTRSEQNYCVGAMTYSFYNPVSGETVYHSGSEIGELSLFEFASSENMRAGIWVETVAVLAVFVVIAILIYAFYFNQKLLLSENGIIGTASRGKKVKYNYGQITSVKKSFLKGISIKTTGQETYTYRFMKNQTQVIEAISTCLSINSAKHMRMSSDTNDYSAADQIKEYKTLLDSGVITQEEFDAKKKQLLNLWLGKKEYNALIERLNNPKNAERKNRLFQTFNGFDLAFHIKRINAYVHCEKISDCVEKDLLKSDYSVSLKAVKKMMDEQGWK